VFLHEGIELKSLKGKHGGCMECEGWKFIGIVQKSQRMNGDEGLALIEKVLKLCYPFFVMDQLKVIVEQSKPAGEGFLFTQSGTKAEKRTGYHRQTMLPYGTLSFLLNLMDFIENDILQPSSPIFLRVRK